jgi:hypothetical protein
MTFRGPDGKQYVVIAAGGHGLPIAPLGDYVIAFTLGEGSTGSTGSDRSSASDKP